MLSIKRTPSLAILWLLTGEFLAFTSFNLALIGLKFYTLMNLIDTRKQTNNTTITTDAVPFHSLYLFL